MPKLSTLGTGSATALQLQRLVAGVISQAANAAQAAAILASQPRSSELDALALLSSNVFGRALLELADVAALRTAAGLGSAALLLADNDGTFAANSDLRVPTQKAARTFMENLVAALVDSAPGTLNTINEIANALGDDPNLSATLTTLIGTKLSKASNLSDLVSASAALDNLGFSANSKSLIAAADYAAMRILLGLVIGTNIVGLVNGNAILPKTSGKGIQVDLDVPSFGWRDITGAIEVKGNGAADPAWSVYTGIAAISAYAFSATVMKEVWLVFHVPHDYVPGTDIFLHTHWSNAAAVPNQGNVVWGFDYTHAKGHNQASFGATANALVTQACPAQRYRHNIAETGALTLAGLEPDSLIFVHIYRDATNVLDTCTDAVFLHTADVHYQSTNMATKQKSPDFYT